jgi:ferredoxin-NADP reductase
MLHDTLDEGAFVNASAPAGDFVLEPGERPVALVSAGIGVTPMLSMLRDIVDRGDPRDVVFVHAARDGRHHPLAAEARTLAGAAPNAARHVFYSRPNPEDRRGHDFEVEGRLDAERLLGLLPGNDVDVYLCGPVAFMAQIQDGLEAHGVSTDRIHSESFGPVG